MTADAALSACPACGADAPANARFCARCGARLDNGDTLRAPVPEPDPDDVPVSYAHAEPRLFGVTPPVPLLIVALVALAGAVALVATAHWVAAVIMLLLAGALLFAFAQSARRLPDDTVSRTAADTAWHLRDRAGFARVSVSTWSRTGREVVRLRVERQRLRNELGRRIRALGDAVYRDDDVTAAAVKAEARALGERIDQIEREVAAAVALASHRVGREREAMQSTEVLADADAAALSDAGDRR